MNKQQIGKIIGWIASGLVLAGVIAVIVLIVLVVWRQGGTDNDNQGYVSGRTYSLSEWSVYVDIPQEFEKETDQISVGYFKDPSTGADAYYLVSQELKDAKYLCARDKSFETNGAFVVLKRAYKQQPSQNGSLLTAKHVGDYYYWMDNPPFLGNCYSDALMSKYFPASLITVRDSIRDKANP